MITFKNILNEGTKNGNMKYYHGTSDGKLGLQIINDGIIKSGMVKRKGWQKPREGRVYLTQDLEYATIYTIGAAMIGKNIDAWIKDEGRYGYLFVVNRNEIGTDTIPDEDFVGELISKKTFPWLNEKAKKIFSNDMYNKAMQGDAMYQIRMGNILLNKNRLNKYEIEEILKTGCAISVKSPVKFDECYKFDKTLNKYLNEDASNFFEYAEKII
jgi:hypothetical protein